MIKTSPPGRWPGHALALLAGLVFPLGLAPLNQVWLIPLALAMFAWLLRDQTPRQAFWRGWWFGLGFWGMGASWVYVSIHFFGGTSLPLSVLLTAAFVALLALIHGLTGWLYAQFRLQQTEVFSFPALWVGMEWLRVWFLSGFPWLFAGYGFIDTPLAHYGPITGVLGISLLAALGGTLLLQILQGQARQKLAAVIALVAILVGGFGLGKLTWTYPDREDPLRVALVQANIAQEMKWDPARRDHIINTYVGMTTPLLGETDLIIWPEAAFPVFYADALPLIASIDMNARDSGTAFISGVPFWEPGEDGDPVYYNSVFAAGQGSGIYHKQTLVPFGEYVPLESLIRGIIPFFDLPMSSFSAGSDDQSPLIAKGYSLAPYICYEIVYPELVRALGRKADVLLTISNDAWFGHSFGPLQHFEMARMRALEMGRYLIRATNTGITALVDPQGKVVERLPSFEQGTLKGEVYRTVGETPYAAAGYWPVLGLCALLLLVAGIRGRRHALHG